MNRADQQRRMAGAEVDGQSRGGRPEQLNRRTNSRCSRGRRPERLDAGGTQQDSRFAQPLSLSPPLLSFFCSPLPSPAEAMRRPTWEYRHAISYAHPFLCVIFPACDRLPLVWRPPDALVIPWCERRRHTNRGCGGEDAPIRSSPRRLGDAVKTMKTTNNLKGGVTARDCNHGVS
jgi:hypothetical protein